MARQLTIRRVDANYDASNPPPGSFQQVSFEDDKPNDKLLVTNVHPEINARDVDLANPGTQQLTKPDTGIRGLTLTIEFVMGQVVKTGPVDAPTPALLQDLWTLNYWGVQAKYLKGKFKARFAVEFPLTGKGMAMSWFNIPHDKIKQELGYKLISVSLDSLASPDNKVDGRILLEASGRDVEKATIAGLAP